MNDRPESLHALSRMTPPEITEWILADGYAALTARLGRMTSPLPVSNVRRLADRLHQLAVVGDVDWPTLRAVVDAALVNRNEEVLDGAGALVHDVALSLDGVGELTRREVVVTQIESPGMLFILVGSCVGHIERDGDAFTFRLDSEAGRTRIDGRTRTEPPGTEGGSFAIEGHARGDWREAQAEAFAEFARQHARGNPAVVGAVAHMIPTGS